LPPQSNPQQPHFFAGLVIHLVRRGIGGVQFNVLCERIKDKGTRLLPLCCTSGSTRPLVHERNE
jgi:hypothetical protein